MIILRQREFSDKKSETEKSEARGKTAKRVGIGSLVAGEAVGTKFILNMKTPKDRGAEDKELFEKLTKLAKEKGVDTNGGPSPLGPAYIDKLDTIVGLEEGKGADYLSHELGHRHYFKEKEAKKVGKAAHKIYGGTGGSLVHGIVVPVASGIAAGKIAGKRKAEKEAKGEKESFVNKHAAWAAPLAATAPMLISEAAASRHGIKSLKAAGASKKYLKEAKKNLATAYGTYATKAVAGSALGQAVKESTYRKEKKKLKKKED